MRQGSSATRFRCRLSRIRRSKPSQSLDLSILSPLAILEGARRFWADAISWDGAAVASSESDFWGEAAGTGVVSVAASGAAG